MKQAERLGVVGGCFLKLSVTLSDVTYVVTIGSHLDYSRHLNLNLKLLAPPSFSSYARIASQFDSAILARGAADMQRRRR